MNVDRGSKNSDINWVVLLAIALAAAFAIVTFGVTRSDSTWQGISPVSGLMTLRTTAQEAIPYDVAMANQRPTLIEFYANWCTTCQAMAPTLQSIQHQIGSQVNFVMMNIDDPQWADQVKQFQVTGVPHLTLLHSDHTVADTFVGEVPKQVITHKVAALLS